MILANLNLVVPVVAATLVIIVAIIVICVLRGKGNYNKGTVKCMLYSRYDRARQRYARHENAVPLDPRLGRLEHCRSGRGHRCRGRCGYRCHLRGTFQESSRASPN